MEHEIKFIIEDESEAPSEEIYADEEDESDEDGDSSETDSLASEDDSEDPMDWEGDRTPKVRLDKWLWAARFFKTRALARFAVEDGRVFYNGLRSKPTREIEVGATVHIRHGRFEKVVIVKGLSTRRRSTDEALQLFEEVPPSRYSREPNFNKPDFGHSEHSRPERHDRMDYNRQNHHRGEYGSQNRMDWQSQSQPRDRNQFQRPSLYNPQARHNYEQQSNYQERSYYDHNSQQPREKRQVRFLRRPNVTKEGMDSRFDNRMDKGNVRNEQSSYSQPYSNYNHRNTNQPYGNQGGHPYNRGYNNNTNPYEKRTSYRGEFERKKEYETFE